MNTNETKPADQKPRLVMHPKVEAAILKLQEASKRTACEFCERMLKEVANDLRKL